MLITNLGKGGAQRVFYDHALAFAAQYQVTEAVFNSAEDERIYDSGLKISSLDDRKAGIKGPLGRILNRARSLKTLVQQEDADLVVSHMDGANWVNVLSGSKAKKLLVVHGTVLHDKDQHSGMQWLRRKIIIPYLYNKADLTVAVSEGIAHELKTKCGVKNVIAIPNFFDSDAIAEKAAVPIPDQYEALFAGYQVLITSGRLADQKKQGILPAIFKRIQQAAPQAKLVILGDGPLRDELIEKSTAAGLKVYHVWDKQLPYHEDYDIFFLGYIDNPYQYLRRSTLFLFPSAWEGFPMALCEAMVSGVPVLSADCPTGPREILAPGTVDISYSLQKATYTLNGVLMPMVEKPGCEEEWIHAVVSLLGDEKKRLAMKAAAFNRVLDFSKAKIVARWYETIDQLCNRK